MNNIKILNPQFRVLCQMEISRTRCQKANHQYISNTKENNVTVVSINPRYIIEPIDEKYSSAAKLSF